MSGICDMCRRTTCEYRADDIAVCGLPKSETNWERLFGTPERAARTLGDYCYNMVSCSECGIRCEGKRFEGGDAILEWLRGDE